MKRSKKLKTITVENMVHWLEMLDPDLEVNCWTSGGDYGRPQVVRISKDNKIIRVVLEAAEDE